MSSKSSGISMERELRDHFWNQGCVVTRVAASGGTKNPEPDLIVGSRKGNYALEAKTTSKNKKYFGRDEVKQLLFYAENHKACTALLAVRFKGDKTWYLAPPEDVRRTQKSFVMEKNNVEDYMTVDDLFNENPKHRQVTL